eukprot:6551976-Lingulodinium_polyedra.AAC.1
MDLKTVVLLARAKLRDPRSATLAVARNDWDPGSKNGMVVALHWEQIGEEVLPVALQQLQFWHLVRHKYSPQIQVWVKWRSSSSSS